MEVDFGVTAQDYARYRPGFPDAFFQRIEALGIGRPGQRVLDLGTGTGALARPLARRGCRVTGLDHSAPLLRQARALDAAAGVSVEYVAGRAEATGLPPGAFDAVTAGQCWHWFDRPRVTVEAARLLAPGGVLLIAHFDPIPIPGSVAEATERLIRRHNPEWTLSGGSGIYPAWFAGLTSAGFERLESFSFDHSEPYAHEAWRGRLRASSGVGAMLSPDAVARFDADLADLLAREFPGEPLSVLHRVFAVVGRRP